MPDLSAVLALAAAGYHLLPLRAGDKRPFPGTRGVLDASADPAQVVQWAERYPDCNWGIATGPSGLLVVDVDRKGGGHELAELLYGLTPEAAAAQGCVVVGTPSGGYHIYYRGTGPSTASRLAPGVDTRGEGGYVVAPFSTVGGREYTLLGGPLLDGPGGLPPVPQIVRDGLADAGGPREKCNDRVAEGVTLDTPSAVAKATHYLLHDAPPAIEGQQGDLTTFRVACAVKDLGISEQLCHVLMEELYNPRCEPPWELRDLRVKVRSAYRNSTQLVGEDAPDEALEFPEDGLEEELEAARAAKPPNPFTPLRGEAIEALPEVEWLVGDSERPFVARGSLAMLVGTRGAYKSFLALDLALAVATGRAWLGHAPAARGRVIYWAGEGQIGLRKRFKAWRTHYEEAIPEAFGLVTAPLPLDAHSKPFRAFCAALDAEPEPPALVVIDTLARAALGLDENSNSDMGRLVAACDHLRRRYGCTVLLVHHSGKSGDGPRGASALPAAVDTEITVARPEGTRGLVEVRVTKQKDAEEVAPFTARATVVDYGDGSSLVFAVGEEAGEEASELESSVIPLYRDVFREIAEANPATRLFTVAHLTAELEHYAERFGLPVVDRTTCRRIILKAAKLGVLRASTSVPGAYHIVQPQGSSP